MKIEYLQYKNFFSVSETPVEVRFANYGNIVLIEGINKDIHKDDEEVDEDNNIKHSNGAGKSTVCDALFYCLYGDFIRKKVSHQEAINQTTGKNLYVELIFELNGFHYRIVRTRKPNTLKLWRSQDREWSDENEITAGGIPATQKEIDNIIGLNSKAFANVVYFGQHNEKTFLDSDAKDKRAIADSLLAIDAFKKCADLAKEELKSIKKDYKNELDKYDTLKGDQLNIANRLESVKKQDGEWKSRCENDIVKLTQEIAQIKDKISSLEDKPDNNEDKVIELNEKLNIAKANHSTYSNNLQEGKETRQLVESKIQKIKLAKSKLDQEASNINSDISRIKNRISELNQLKDNVQCDTCLGNINLENAKFYIANQQTVIATHEEQAKEINSKITKFTTALGQYQEAERKLFSQIQHLTNKIHIEDNNIITIHQKLNKLSDTSNLNTENLALKEKLSYVSERLEEKQKERDQDSPYLSLIADLNKDLQSKTESVSACKESIDIYEEKIPYYNWWIKGYSDGIRSYIINDILPSLNDRINYWLSILVNGKVNLTFDNTLEPFIESNPPNGNQYQYHLMSGGLKKRIDLSILHSFADVMMLSSGTMPSVVFLDEIGNDFDIIGKQQIYNMIVEFSQHRQVFIITHDVTLLEMLGETDSLTMKLENGITEKV